MTARTRPSDCTQDQSCPKSGDSSVDIGSYLPRIEDAKASHITGGDDWFPSSQWPSSGSNSGNSTGRHCSYRRLATHEPAVNLEPPLTSSENSRELPGKLSSARDNWTAYDQAICEIGKEYVDGTPQDACETSESLCAKEIGSPRDSTVARSSRIGAVTAQDSQLPPQGIRSATNRNNAKTSLVCGPLSVQQTLTERQLDIEKRMVEVRQQNRRRLHRRQQEAKEQQLQRIKEHRAALLARREKIKLASLWKERGMAAAARPAAICKGGRKVERLPSEASQPTESDSRSAEELLTALVISESISLQTELGSREDDVSADLAKKATYQASFAFHHRTRSPDASVPTSLAPTHPMVSISSTAPQRKAPLCKRGINSVRQTTAEPKTANAGASVSHKLTDQRSCTLLDTLPSCRPENRLSSLQKVRSLGLQFQSVPLVSHSSEAPYLNEGAISLALLHRAKPRIKQANSEEPDGSFLENGEHRMSILLNDQECEQGKQVQCKVGPAFVGADQHVKKQVSVQLQQHQQHLLTRKPDIFRATDIPEGVASPSVISVRKTEGSYRPLSTNSKLARDHGATEMGGPAHFRVNKATEMANICQRKECATPSISPEKSITRQTRDRRTSEEKEGKNSVPLFSRKERMASCSFENVTVTKLQTASSAMPTKWEGCTKAQAAGLQLVRIYRDAWSEKELFQHVLENVPSSDSQEAPSKALQMHERGMSCVRNLKLPLGKNDRSTMHFPSSYGESDCSSAATKPQEDEIDKSGARTSAKEAKDGAKLHISTKAANAELIEDEDPTISAVWALQQAEVEEEKRLLLLEISQHAIEKQAQARRKERSVQSQLLAQHFQGEHQNRHETFACCSRQPEKRQPCAEASSPAMKTGNEPVVRKIEYSSCPNPTDSGSSTKVPSHFHLSLPLAKEGNFQNAGTTRNIQASKHFRWGPAPNAHNASSRTAPKPRLYAVAPSKNSLDVPRPAEATKRGEGKVLDNGQHGNSLLKQQQDLIGQLLGHGPLAGQNRAGLPEVPKADVRDKYNACLEARAMQRRAVLQALQHLLLFPSRASHPNRLKKGYRLEKEGSVPTQGRKAVSSQRNYRGQIPTGRPHHSASSAVGNTIREGIHSNGPLFCRSSSISRGTTGLPSPLSAAGRVEQQVTSRLP